MRPWCFALGSARQNHRGAVFGGSLVRGTDSLALYYLRLARFASDDAVASNLSSAQKAKRQSSERTTVFLGKSDKKDIFARFCLDLNRRVLITSKCNCFYSIRNGKTMISKSFRGFESKNYFISSRVPSL
jgi:hypothetical protein